MFSKIQVEYLLKNYIIFLGGGHQKITLDYRGEGGGRSRESKKGLRNFLMVLYQFPSEENIDHVMTSPDPHNHITLIECSG